MADYKVNDSGERQVHATGAVRDVDTNKPRPDLRSPFAAERVGNWMRLGALKYSDNNWHKGFKFSRMLASLERHLMYYKQGRRDEDNLAAIIFNAEALIHYEEMLRRGVLPAELDDLPKYEPTKAEAPEEVAS